MADPVKKPTERGRREARRTPRRVYMRPVGILRGGKYELQRGLQLSEGGMLFQSSETFKSAQQVVVTMIIPSGGAVVARGEIIYVNKSAGGGDPHYGVRFSDLTLQLRRLIRNYVSAKTQEEAEIESLD